MTIGSKSGIDVGIVAADIDAMLQFYVETLGLSYVESLAIPWGTMHRLSFGESWLKLVDPIAPVVNGSGPIDGASGLRYVTFEIDDLDEVWSALVASGAPVYHDKAPFGTKGVEMGMVLDPDGNVVELLKRPSTAAVRPSPA